MSEGEKALTRARAAMRTQDFSHAYAEYRSALSLLPRNGPQHDEALRGFSENALKLAQQRISEGRTQEAEAIAREVLNANTSYRPALDLLARLRAVSNAGPRVRSAPSPSNTMQGLTVTTPLTPVPRTPRMRSEPHIVRAMPPPKPETAEATTAVPPRQQPPFPTPAVRVKQPLVKVFFATDRLPSAGAAGPSNYFGKEWNKTDDHLVTGFVTVSIPPVHKEGTVERPFKWWIIEFQEDPKKHFVLTELQVTKGDDFYSALRSEYAQREAEKRSAFVFIHGFNVTFDEAAFSTAQIAYDLDFEGVPILYSWPSQGALLAYDGDEETVEWSSPHLQSFLERVARESGAGRIHVIAHSMGNRLLANALVGLKGQPDIQPLFDNVIMAAPDVNAYTFTDQIWPKIKMAAKRFTLYASSDDRALLASKEAKGNQDFDRLGEAGSKIVVISGLDTVDASGIDTSLLGHSYVDSCKPVMDDLQLLMAKGFAPLQRNLRDREKGGLAYWAFP